jgi:hypothetical protein
MPLVCDYYGKDIHHRTRRQEALGQAIEVMDVIQWGWVPIKCTQTGEDRNSAIIDHLQK